MPPQDVLTENEYGTYRNVRAIAIYYLFFSIIFISTATCLGPASFSSDKPEKAPVVAGIILLVLFVIGLSGLIGSLAILRRSQKFTSAITLMVFLFLFAFPIGTFLSIILILKLDDYKAISLKLRAAGE